MILKAYSVHDSAVGAYLQPFFCRSDGEATRTFSDACNNPDHNFNRHADDYILFRIGEYDEETGGLVGHAPVSLGVAVEYLQEKFPQMIGSEHGKA